MNNQCLVMRTLLSMPALLAVASVLHAQPAASPQGLPSETPQVLTPSVGSFDYVRRDVMIPMRDGVKLRTVILIPRGAHRAPILLTRTPYGADDHVADSAHLTTLL